MGTDSQTYRVLVIDDEQVVLDASGRLLKAEGFDVRCAENAERGLQLVASFAPHVAVVDLKLPGWSGLEFIERAHSINVDLRVILTTGIAGADQAVAALGQGAFDFLPKPFTYEELMSPVLRACRDIGLGNAAPPSNAEGLLMLGVQGWAKQSGESTFRVGASEIFQRTAGAIVEIVPPKIGSDVRQGSPLARVRTGDARWHVVVAAAGGRVTAVNHQLFEKPGLMNSDPFGEGWIAEIRLAEIHHDARNLRPLD